MAIIEHEYVKTKRNLVDQFNHALTLLHTTSEDIRLNAHVSRTFYEQAPYCAGLTRDAGLIQQYELLGEALLSSNTKDSSVDKETLILSAGKLCIAGAQIRMQSAAHLLQEVAPEFLNIAHHVQHNILLQERMMIIDNVRINPIITPEAMQCFAQALISNSKDEQVSYIMLRGAFHELYAFTTQLKIVAPHLREIANCKKDDAVWVMFRCSLMQ